MRNLNETKFEWTRPNESYLDVSSAEDLAEVLTKVEKFSKVKRTVTVKNPLWGADVDSLYELAEDWALDNVKDIVVNPLLLDSNDFDYLMNLEQVLPENCTLSFVDEDGNVLVRDEVIWLKLQHEYTPIDEREDYY